MSRHKGKHHSNSDDKSGALYWLKRLLAVLGIGLIGVVAFALARSPSWNALGFAVVTAVGAFLVGILLGLLYGMPVEKPSSSAEQKAPEGAGSQAGSSASQTGGSPYRPSTKLQEVADWLTKIIIGLGLVEMGKISSKISDLSALVGGGLGGSPSSSKAFALGILTCSFVGGFLFGFIWADVFLPGMLSAVYFKKLQDKVLSLEGSLKQLRGYVEKWDLNALRLSEQWLSQLSSDAASETKLRAAINTASPTARCTVFNQAYELDRPAWTREQRMDRRVLIYQALVDQDKDGRFHRNRGQLGVALATRNHKNKNSDCEWAIEMLDQAIRFRDRDKCTGWRNYEFYRAYARIALDRGEDEVIKGDLNEAANGDSLLLQRMHYVESHKTANPTGHSWMSIFPHKTANPPAAPGPREDRDEYTDKDIHAVLDWGLKHNWKPPALAHPVAA